MNQQTDSIIRNSHKAIAAHCCPRQLWTTKTTNRLLEQSGGCLRRVALYRTECKNTIGHYESGARLVYLSFRKSRKLLHKPSIRMSDCPRPRSNRQTTPKFFALVSFSFAQFCWGWVLVCWGWVLVFWGLLMFRLAVSSLSKVGRYPKSWWAEWAICVCRLIDQDSFTSEIVLRSSYVR